MEFQKKLCFAILTCMNVPYPLIIPVDDVQKVYKGFISINNVEYEIKVQLGDEGTLTGEKKFLELLEQQQQRGSTIQDVITKKLRHATDIMLFLTDLQELLEAPPTSVTQPLQSQQQQHSFRYDHDRFVYIYNELLNVGYDQVHEISEDMTNITFKINDTQGRAHFVKVILPLTYPLSKPKVVCNLPVPIEHNRTITEIIQQHRVIIDRYQKLFDCLDDLDQHMRILEPENPTRSDNWRRIALGHHCSMEVDLSSNLETPLSVKPRVRFLGSMNRVKDLKAQWALYKWDKDRPMSENLLEAFQMVSNTENNNVHEDYTNIGDIECGICYSYKLNQKDTPDIICANESCNRGFHYQCLYEWVRSNPSTTQSFNILFGKCPYCNEPIHVKLR
ncbi:WD-repeat region-domain-containing protein [Mycotypha africana]|uniref:WD-repeat region-domain-containing protein n=1 Tax=Mycotypha africana TaxID=64632 RepID=UPI00230169EE|nr:WD-repeat region-domain-containing protein [Mycotypha africana]KAI8984661.1 WD-repeat region-domain-containing protein [Mycotypha africana]